MADRAGDGRTMEAWLMNAQGRVTLHSFHGTERVPAVDLLAETADGRPSPSDTDGIGLVYRCTETGLTRRWGLERLRDHGIGGGR